MYIRRAQEDLLFSLIEQSSAPHTVLLVEGARQTGKTTLVHQVLTRFENVIQFNLERDKLLRKDIDLANSFDDFAAILTKEGLRPRTNQILFIDEAQESEQIGGYIRFMKEEWLHTRVILSGSSMTRLFRPEMRIPVGRIKRLLIQPLSFYEFLGAEKFIHLKNAVDEFSPNSGLSPYLHKEFLSCLDQYLLTGGLPEVVTSYLQKEDFGRVRREILIHQEDDFVRKVGFINSELFTSGLRGVANHLGGPSAYSHLSDNLKASKTIAALLSDWKLVHELEQKSFTSTTSLSPKRYLYDLGIAQDLRNQPFPNLSVLSTRSSSLRTQLGGLFENFVLIACKEFKLGGPDISGWKDGAGNTPEVDFILRLDNAVIPVECKATQKVNRRNFSSLIHYLRKAELKVGLLVTAAPFQIFKANDITLLNVPAYLFRVETIQNILLHLRLVGNNLE